MSRGYTFMWFLIAIGRLHPYFNGILAQIHYVRTPYVKVVYGSSNAFGIRL